MGKHRTFKSPKQDRSKAEPSKPTEPHDLALLLPRVAVHLEQLMGLVEQAVADGEATPALLRESTSVARAIATLSAELRAREKAAHNGKISQQEVAAFLRNMLDESSWMHLRREIDAHHGVGGHKASVLA